MNSCSSNELSVLDLTNKLVEEGFHKITEYTSPELLSTIKQFLDSIGFPGYRETTDTFILYKGILGGYVVEFAKGCTEVFVALDQPTLERFLGLMGSNL